MLKRLKSSLEFLDLGGNQFGDLGAKAIAAALKVNNNLSVLCLDDNRIGVLGAQELSKSIENFGDQAAQSIA